MNKVSLRTPRQQTTLERSLLQSIHSVLPQGKRILVAVSGGKDSVTLLSLLVALCGIRKQEIIVAHVDHALRPNSKRDAAFVKTLSRSLGLEYFSKRLKPVASLSNTEAWARSERYQFLSSTLKKTRSDWIVTAHHQDDLAETLLIRLIQNRELGTMSLVDEQRRIARPLLLVAQASLAAYAKEKGLRWVEDETNATDLYLRNRIRRSVIPTLRKISGSSVASILGERALSLNRDLSALRWLAETLALEIPPVKFGDAQWLKSTRLILGMVPEGVSWRVAETLITRTGKLQSLGERHSRKVAEFILRKDSKRLELPGGLLLERKGKRIKFVKKSVGT